MIQHVLLVGLGGGAGSMLRYLCQYWLQRTYPHPFPWGTLLVNLSGCFLIGALFGFSLRHQGQPDTWKLLLMTGLCGGFTTFSAFTIESIGLIRDHKTGLFILYITASIGLGLLATLSGIRLFRPV